MPATEPETLFRRMGFSLRYPETRALKIFIYCCILFDIVILLPQVLP